MRPGQNRRVRGRSRSKGPNPLTRSYESNGPDVKVRGTAQHIADKYAQLARDAQSSGDPVAAENYYQHAEHYYRIIAAAQEQFRQQFGGYGQRPFDEDGEDGDEEAGPNGFPYPSGERPAGAANGENADFGNQPQPYEARRDDRSQRSERPQERPSAALSTAAGTIAPSARIAASGSGRIAAASATGAIATTAPEAARPSAASGTSATTARRPRSETGASGTTARIAGEPGAGARTRAFRPRRAGAAPPEAPRENRAEARGDGPRHRERRREETEEPAGLPAFLTNPVRAPIAVEEAAVEASARAGRSRG